MDNIKVTVTDNTGNKYATLTDAEDAFTFNLSAGNYLVSLNEGAFDNNFKPIEITKEADLVHNNTINLTFGIVQKKRQVNIRKEE